MNQFFECDGKQSQKEAAWWRCSWANVVEQVLQQASEQDVGVGEVLPLVEKDFDREVNDCEIEDVLQMLLGLH